MIQIWIISCPGAAGGKTKAPLNKSIGAFHSAFTVFGPSGPGAFDDPGGALSGIGWRTGVV